MTHTPPSLSTLATNPRASIRAWSRYRETVHAARRQHPETFVVTPTSFSPATFTSQLRDAVRGCIAFDYEGDGEALSLWWQQVVVRFDEKKVYIGPPPKKTDEAAEFLKERKGELSFDSLDLEEAQAFRLLLSRGRLICSVHVRHPQGLEVMQSVNNCELSNQPDGSLLML